MAGTSPPTTDVGFVQQGQVDWIAFGKTTVSMTLDILARFQAAGVQELTYAGVMQLTTRFKLPALGRQRIWDAVQNLRVVSGASNILYFGFGHRSFLRFLSESVSGLKCIALCSCLAEIYSEDIAAKVLVALWKEFDYPENFEPSLHQFKALLKSCGGALATTPFPEIAGRLHCPQLAKLGLMECADPADIAKALNGLFEISAGVRQSIMLVGNSNCSFIAAVAYWLFNLDVYVEDVDGQIIFSSSLSNRPLSSTTAQVHVKYVSDEELQSRMVLSQSTFLLGNASDILKYTSDSTSLMIRRRVPWETCLETTFGRGFQELCDCRTALGLLFGSVARISLALAEGETDVQSLSREAYREFSETSYGRGFIDSVGNLFPELGKLDLRREMEAVLSESVLQAYLFLEESILSLKRASELIRRVHIMPGHIARTDPKYKDAACKQYDRVRDIDVAGTDLDALTVLQSMPGVHEISTDEVDVLRGEDMVPILVEAGNAAELYLMYRIGAKSDEITIRPGALTDHILRRTGLIPCDKLGCSSEYDRSARFHTVKSGWAIDINDYEQYHEGSCYFWNGLRTSEWQASSRASISTEQESSDIESNYRLNDFPEHEALVPILNKQKFAILAERIQALEDEKNGRKDERDDEIEKLEGRLSKATILCTSLLCINIAMSGLVFLKYMGKQ
ncbi:hypothetical protein IL306_006256 [Fusarium sp. DS 682]|nr:hypothetical protein IL306_006256 [Fusarium sp. DS 682]